MNFTINSTSNYKNNTAFGMYKATPETANTIAGLLGEKVAVNLGNPEHIKEYLPKTLQKHITEFTEKYKNYYLTEKEADDIFWKARAHYDKTKQRLVNKASTAVEIKAKDVKDIAAKYLTKMSKITTEADIDTGFQKKNYHDVLLEMNEKIAMAKQKVVDQLKALGVVTE